MDDAKQNTSKVTNNAKMGARAAMRASQNARRTPHAGNWITGSGREMFLQVENKDNFLLSEDRIYVLSRNGSALWAGTHTDLIQDQNSRQKFRTSISQADHVASIDAPNDPTDALCFTYDLAAGHAPHHQTAA